MDSCSSSHSIHRIVVVVVSHSVVSMNDVVEFKGVIRMMMMMMMIVIVMIVIIKIVIVMIIMKSI